MLGTLSCNGRDATFLSLLEKGKNEFKKDAEEQDFSVSVIYLEEAQKIKPDNQEVHYFLGYTYERLSAKDGMLNSNLELSMKASEQFKKVIGIAPKYEGELLTLDPYSKITSIWGSMAMACLSRGQVDSAIWAFKYGQAEGGYIPGLLEYGKNILKSCEKDAILFTNGDNDTFPLWFLQEVENFRKDVRVVNLSLLNTTWFIKLLRDTNPKIPINFTDNYIDNKLMEHNSDRLFQEPTREVTVGGLTWDLKPSRVVSYQGKKYGYLTVQDMMVIRIIDQNKWERPVYFAVTVASENKINLDKYLRMEGLVLRLVQEEGEDQLDPDRAMNNLWNAYQYEHINDPSTYNSDAMPKLFSNYQAIFIYLAQTLMQQGKNEEAVKQVDRVNELFPSDDWRTFMFTAQLYTNMKKYAEAVEYMKKALKLNPEFTQGKLNLPVLLHRAGKYQEAITAYRELIEEKPDLSQAYTGLANLYAKEEDFQQAIDVLEDWLTRNPNDTGAQKKLQEYQEALSTSGSGSPD